MLQSPNPLPFEALLTPLLNEFAQLQTNLILVLDDYHLITATVVHDALNFVLEQLPNHVHLAIAWAKNSGLSIEDNLHYSRTEQFPGACELDYLTYARVLLAEGRSQDALRLLTRLQEFAQAGGRTIRVIEALLLQALVFHAQGDLERSLDALNQALNIPHQGHYTRLFLDEGKPMAELLQRASAKNIHPDAINRLLRILNSVQENPTITNQPLIAPLSDRELEVLQYLGTGMSNQAIADQLFVSLAAVKWHPRNIYGKLEVNNRTQAVARARESRIIE